MGTKSNISLLGFRRRMMLAVTDKKPDYSTWRGVFIEDIDGNLYTEAEWDGTKTANGIAVLTDECRFVMALQYAKTSVGWGGYSVYVNEITTVDTESKAKKDYDGEIQTTAILNQINDTTNAAYYCREFTFPNGKKGYLGAAGEWWAVLNNKDAIKTALTKCGGIEMRNSAHWTSTQNDSTYSWTADWKNICLLAFPKDTSGSARAFCEI